MLLIHSLSFGNWNISVTDLNLLLIFLKRTSTETFGKALQLHKINTELKILVWINLLFINSFNYSK